MVHLQVTVAIDAPIERVFEDVSDHALFLTGPQAICRLKREGSPDRNGLSAVREVRAGSILFEEEIIQFEPPRRFDYVITRVVGKSGRPLPLKHERGWLTFEALNGSTVVQWDTRFSITVPILGWLFERFQVRRMTPLFRETLLRAKDRLEASPPIK